MSVVTRTPSLELKDACDIQTNIPQTANQIAGFVKPQDSIAAWIAIQMYQKPPNEVLGFQLIQETDHVAVYTRGLEAIVAFRGTALFQKGALQDISDDFQITFGEGCSLAITSQGIPIIQELYQFGYSITLTGHSLGGKAAICLGKMPGVVNIVALNAGAPVVNSDTGPGFGTHYHIVGDIISTHVYGMETVRVFMQAPKYSNPILVDSKDETKINWLNPWYHGSERFLQGTGWSFVSAQFEQDSIEDFFFVTGTKNLRRVNVITSIFGLSWFGVASKMICTNPIPNSVGGKKCQEEIFSGKRDNERTNFGIMGALFGALIGPYAFIAGALIGQGLYDGDLGPTLSALIPGYAAASFAVKKYISNLIKTSGNQNNLVEKLKNVLDKS